MKNRTYPAVIVCLLAVSAITAPAFQKDAQPVFKVGDRVLASPMAMKDAQYWYPCTITSGLKSNAYGVKCDPRHAGEMPNEYNVMPEWVKAAGTGDALAAKPNYQTQKKNESADGTVLPGRPFLDCDIAQKKARNGDAIPAALARKLIQCLWEKHARLGYDGAETVDVDSMEAGKPHKWVYQRDLGQGIADINTLVWPFDVKWTWKTFYRSRTHVTVQENIFNCYVNSFAKWSCGLGQGIKEISTKDVPVE